MSEELAGFTVRVVTIYAARMAKKITLRIKGVDTVTIIHADEVTKDGPILIIKKGPTVVGEFKDSEVQGWWISD